MNSKLCETCQKEARIVCFCNSLLFCEECIGKHLLSDGNFSHKPIVLNEEYTKIIEISIEKLKESEAEILSQAEKSHNIKISMMHRLKQEIDRINDFSNRCTEDLGVFIEKLKAELDEVHRKILENLYTSCNDLKSHISHLTSEIESNNYDSYPLLSLLHNCNDFKEMSSIEIVSFSSKIENLFLSPLILSKTIFSVNLKDLPQSNQNEPSRLALKKIGYSSTPDSHMQHRSNSLSSEDRNVEDLDTHFPFRYSVNIESPFKQAQDIYDSLPISSKSPLEKPRRYTYHKSSTNKLSSPVRFNKISRKPPTSLIWIDNISECLISYSIGSGEITSTFLSTQDQSFAGNVWSFINDESLIITGGLSNIARKQTLIIDVTNGSAFNGNSMHVGRYHHAAVCVGQYLYVMGGSNGVAIKDCEKYNILTNLWQKVGNLNVAREHLAACVHRGRIYVAGGEGADSIETYNTVSNKFSLLRVRLPGFSKTFMASVDDQILIFHKKKVISFDSSKMSCVEYCDLNEDNWWSPANSIVARKLVFFIKKGTVYKFDVEEVQINSIVSLI